MGNSENLVLPLSHTWHDLSVISLHDLSRHHSVARQCLHCCKGDHLFVWRMEKIGGITQKPLHRLSQNLARVITSAI